MVVPTPPTVRAPVPETAPLKVMVRATSTVGLVERVNPAVLMVPLTARLPVDVVDHV